MAHPGNIDERAKKFFNYGFVGERHGDPGLNGYRYSWDSDAEGLRKTQVFQCSNGVAWCAYCGDKAYPIQDTSRHNWPVVGHTCVCKGAMDEYDWQRAKEEMLARHAEEEAEHFKLRPVAPKPVLARIVKGIQTKLLADLERGFFVEHALKGLGIYHVNTTSRSFDED